MTDVSKPTILKLLADLGPVCARYQDEHLRNLRCRRVQCDEIWQFCYAKQKNVADAKNAPEGAGDVWTWVAHRCRHQTRPVVACRWPRPRLCLHVHARSSRPAN